MSTKPLVISPSILSADFSRLGEDVRAVDEAGADWIHVDVMDGRFVPNLTLGPPVVAALRKVTKMPLDCHLMVVDPDPLAQAFIDVGADLVTVHAEACTHLDRSLQAIRARGCKAGVALNPHTPEAVLDYVLELCDLVLVMSVNPGFGGQSLIERVFPKIERIRTMIDSRGLSTRLEVDGGVKPENAYRFVEAGADVLVAGSAVFGAADRTIAIAGVRGAARP